MNLLEHYIVEVISVEEIKGHKELVYVDMIVDCYGSVYRTSSIFRINDWKEAQEKGYYMA